MEECKQRDLFEELMQEMAGEFPAFSDVFVKERDLFLCHSLQLAALPQAPVVGSGVPRPVRVVGVVGECKMMHMNPMRHSQAEIIIFLHLKVLAMLMELLKCGVVLTR